VTFDLDLDLKYNWMETHQGTIYQCVKFGKEWVFWGGDTERNRRRIDGSSAWLRLGASSTGCGGGWWRFRGL